MFVSFRSTAAAVTCAAFVVLAGALPAFADTSLGHTGKVGPHSLTDTSSSPGARCNYHYVASEDAGKLVQIVVVPPSVKAVAGNSSQTVGWRFTVQRRVQGIGGASDWVARYTSPEMTAVTDDATDAPFTSASVPVKAGAFLVGGIRQYRVIVTMIWHRGDGSVQGKARNRVDFYDGELNTGGSLMEDKHCDAWRHTGAFQ